MAIRFGMPGLPIKVNSPILPIFTRKLSHRPLSDLKKVVKSSICGHMPTIWWKFGDNWFRRSWVLFAQKFIKKKRINASRT